MRRLFANGTKYGDKKIFQNMCIHIERFEEAVLKQTRTKLSRSPTSFIAGSRFSTPNSRAQNQGSIHSEKRTRNEVKESKGAGMRNHWEKRADKGNARATRSRSKGISSVLSLKEFKDMWGDETSKPGGIAKITAEYQRYLKDVEREEFEREDFESVKSEGEESEREESEGEDSI